MIELSDGQLRELQKIELELLLEADRICRENNIRYGMTGGTLLGAVRHKGFIPWDDDADISMLREDYERFKEACMTKLDHTRFYFQDHTNTPGYRWGYGKLRRKGTVFLRENQEHMPYEQGVFIDIFPRDGVPDLALPRKIHSACCFCLRKIQWSAVGRFSAKGAVLKLWYRLLYQIPEKTLWKLYDMLVYWSDRKKRRYIRTLTFPLPGGLDGYEQEGCDGAALLEFEGEKLCADSGYLRWLEREFGDYMQLPPPEKRKIHPVSEIKLLSENEDIAL